MNWTREFSHREKLLLLILAVLLLFALYYFLVYRPVEESLSSCEQRTAALAMDIEVLEARKTRYDSMVTELESIKAAGDLAAVPDYDNLQQLMGFLNSVFGGGTSYSLSIQGVEQPSGSSGIVRRTMQVSFDSPSYYASRSSIEQLQGAPYCCQIGSVSIAPENPREAVSVVSSPVKTTLIITFYESIG